MDEAKEAVERWRSRRGKRLSERTRLDFEVGVYPADEPGDKKTSHGNTRLPYGLCKAAGIDATGMTPYEAWAALEGKTGVTAKEAYKDLKEHGKVDPGKMTGEAKTMTSGEPDGSIPGTEELGNTGTIPEPFPDGAKPATPKKTSDVALPAVKRLNSEKHFLGKKNAQLCIDKLKEVYGEGGKIIVSVGPTMQQTFDLSNPDVAELISKYKKDGLVKITAGANEEEAEQAYRDEMARWKDSTDYRKIQWGYQYDMTLLAEDQANGKITYAERKAKQKEIRKEENEKVLKALPNYDSCATVDSVRARTDALGCFKNGTRMPPTTDIENAREAAKSAELMFKLFPSMKGRVDRLDTSEYKAKAFAWMEGHKDSAIFVSSKYAKDRKLMKDAYEYTLITGYHPPGTDTDSIVYHEFGHVIDFNLSTYILNRGGIPGHPGKMVSTYIVDELANELGMNRESLKHAVSEYAAQKNNKNHQFDDVEFLAECVTEYFGSKHPRNISVGCVNKLFALMREHWGEDAVSEEATKKS